MSINESQITVVIASLLDATGDKDEKVRMAIATSLKKIAKHHLLAVLEATINHRRKHSKLTVQELRFIWGMMKEICEENISNMDDKLVYFVTDYALEESLRLNDLPFTSCDILITLGPKHFVQVYDKISRYMKEDATPQPSIIYIIGNLSMTNIHAFLPFSKSCFDYMLSILPSIKIDSLRKLYATSVAQLAEAVIECVSGDGSSTAKEMYSPVIEEIFEAFSTNWLQTKDSKICESVVRAMGSMILLFNVQKLRDDTPRILNIFLSLYKKPTNTLPRYIITQGISNLLSIVPRATLQPLLDNLLHTLHVMVSITPDFAQPLTVKNHSEVLRCYDYIGVIIEEKLCEVILRNLRSASEQDKVVGLIVSTHLLSSSEKILKPKLNDLISILHNLLNENSIKINRSLVKIIVALAYREYLMEKDSVFIEFLVKHCYHGSSNHELEDLESMCSSTIYLLSTSVPVVQHLCWKILLKVLVSGEYNQSAAIFAKSLAYLISKCDATVFEKNCYERSEAVFVRVISLLGSPLHQGRGVYLLNFLGHYIIWKVKIDVPIWKHKINNLISYLEDTKWDESEWENILFDAFSTSFTEETKNWLISVNTETLMLLTERLAGVENNQNVTHDNNITVSERAMLYKMLAFFTQYVDEESAINSNIEKILYPIHQRSLIDLKACGRAIGILSRTNLSQVLKQMELLQQSLLFRKTTKFLGLIKDSKSETDVETVRRMICECYSEILTEAPARILLPKLKQLAQWFINQMQNSKDSQTKNACLEALFCVSEILLKYEEIYDDVEDCRKSLLSFTISLIDGEKNMPNVIALRIFTTLFKLSFKLPANEKLQLLQKSLNKLFQYYCNTSPGSGSSSSTECKTCEDDPVVLQLCLSIKETVNANSSNAEEIIMFLQPWLSHRIVNLRMVSMYLLKAALNYYVECYLNDSEYSIRFNQMGPLLGKIYVRTLEENKELAKLARECVILLLAVLDCTKNENIKIVDIENELSNVDDFDVENSLIAAHQKFSSTQLSFIIESLINGLLDTNESCCLGTADLLTMLFTEIGSQFNRQALDIFSTMLLNFPKITNEELLTSSSKALISLAKHHTEMFVKTVIKQSIPLHPNVNKIWQILSEDDELSLIVLKILLDLVQTESIHDEDLSSNKPKKLSSRLIAAIYSMKEILTFTANCTFVVDAFSDVFSIFLVLIPQYKGEYLYSADSTSSSNKTSKESTICILPAKLVLDTLLLMMERAKCTDNKENIRNVGNNVEFKRSKTEPAYFELIKCLARFVCNYNCKMVAEILTSINTHCNSNNETVRCTVAVFFSEVLNTKCKDRVDVVESVVNSLLNLLNDTSPVIRENSLTGLASLSTLESRVVEQHKEKVLSALMQGLDDTQALVQHGIILQSLIGLSKLLSSLKNDYPDDIFMSMAIGIKPFFEKENSEIRGISLKLFGELALCVTAKTDEKASFAEQVRSNLICLLFHLAEKENSVSEACKFSLRETSRFLKSSELMSLVEEHLDENASFVYNDFFTQFVKVLGKEFPDHCSDFIMTAMSYSKSNWAEVRGVAATFIGLMYCNQVKVVQEKLPLDFVSVKLLILLKDNDVQVRANAATSLGLVIQATYHEPSETDE